MVSSFAYSPTRCGSSFSRERFILVCQIFVGLELGSMITTRTPNGASSSRSVSLIASIANLLAEYAPITGVETLPLMLLTLIIVPFALLSSGNNACVTRNCAITLTSNCAVRSSNEINSSGAAKAVPALFNSASRRGVAVATICARLATCSAFVISHTTGVMCSLYTSSNALARLSLSSSLRTVPKTCQPCRASCSAVSRPKPLEQPVITIVFVVLLFILRSNTAPQAQAYQFCAGLEAKLMWVHCSSMTKN